MELLALFAASLLAATLVPAQSEVVLGACINWLLGRYLLTLQHRRWFPIKPAAIERATQHYERWGVWSLLFSWLPLIGDPLTLVAGFLRTNFLLFLVLVTLGKAARYVALLAAF